MMGKTMPLIAVVIRPLVDPRWMVDRITRFVVAPPVREVYAVENLLHLSEVKVEAIERHSAHLDLSSSVVTL